MVAEILEEMARHPCLKDRKIPFLILANKEDMGKKCIDTEVLRNYLQLDTLKTMTKMKYDVKETSGLTGSNVGWVMK